MMPSTRSKSKFDFPTGRNSIHNPGKNDGLNKEVLQCNECSQHFEVQDKEVKRKLSEKEVKEYEVKRSKETVLPPELPDAASFLCSHCSEMDNVSPTSAGFSKRKRISVSEDDSDGTTSPDGVSKRPPVGHPSENLKRILFNKHMIGIIGAVVAIFLGSYIYLNHSKEEEKPFNVNLPELNPWEAFLETRIFHLRNTYSNQEEKVWYSLLAGIKSVAKSNPTQPSVFLFLYDNSSAGKTAKCLAKDASGPAIRFLMNKDKKPLIYESADLNTYRYVEDSGRLLVDLNQTVRDSGALIVTELQDLRPEVAKSLHFVCDSYSPLVDRAVLFFTLQVENVPESKLSKVAGDKLREIWKEGMVDSSIDALITRMTPNTIKINSDLESC